MALTGRSRFALTDSVIIGDPSVLVLANGVDSLAWTDGLVSGRTEATVSTTAPDVSSMTAVEADDGAGTLSDGTYYVYVTYKRDAAAGWPAMISGPSAGKEVVIDAGPSHIDIASIPTSSDAQVDDREIYLLGGNLTQPYYVGAVGDNTTTTYEIESTEATIQGNKILSEATGDYPTKRTLAEALPPTFEHLAVWGNRLWGSKDDTLYFSESLPNFEDFPSTNSIVVPRRGGVSAKITQLVVHKRFLYLFYDDAVYIISGTNRDNFRVDQAMTGVGCSGGINAVLSVGDYLYWLDRQKGPVRWRGGGDPEPIGLGIEGFWERVDKNRLRRSVGSYSPRRRELIWKVTEGKYDRNNRNIVYDEMAAVLSVDHQPGTATGVARNELGEKCYLYGNTLGDIFQYDVGDSDGVYTGTQTGTPTTATGLSMADTAATFGSADDVEGRPIYFFDSSGDLLQANTVVTRTSATVLRLMYPIPANVSTYALGGIPFIRASGPTSLDPAGPAKWQHFVIRWVPTTTAATVYVDLKDVGDTDYTNVGSFDTDGDGKRDMVVFKRGEDITWRFRCSTPDVKVKILDVEIKGTATSGARNG